MCPSGETCLPAACCCSELVLWNVLVFHYHLIICNLYSPWDSWKIVHLALNNNHSFTHSCSWSQDKIQTRKRKLLQICFSVSLLGNDDFVFLICGQKYENYWSHFTVRLFWIWTSFWLINLLFLLWFTLYFRYMYIIWFLINVSNFIESGFSDFV